MSFFSNIQHLFNGVDIGDLLQEINSLKKEISFAKKEISRYSTSLTEKNNEIASLKQLNVSLSEDMTRERNKYSILEGKADDLSKTIAELKKEKKILEASEQKFKDECERTTKSNASLNGKNLALTNRVRALEDNITQLESIQLRQQSELSEKDTKISMMGANYDKLQSDYNTNKEQLEEANKTIEGEKSAKKVLAENIAQLQEGNRILSEKSDSLQVTVDELASENSSLKEESAKAKEKINLLTEESSSNESEKSALHEELDKQKSENDSLRQQIQELVAEKEELSPYMYLVEAKKEQEAIESAIKEARENLQKSLDSAMSILSTIKHEEVKNSLEEAIKSSRELVNTVDCTLEELNDSKESLDSASEVAEEQEKKLIDQEEEEERKRQDEEKKHKEQELRNDLERLVGTAKSFCNTISYDDISMPLQAVIDNTEIYIEAGLFEYNTLENKYTTLKNALDEAKKEVESAKKTESHVVKRSILEIFDTKEGDIIDSESFFKRPEHELIRWRRIFEESILAGEHRFICTNCRQDVKISGRKYERGQVAFFSHLHDSDYCEIKTTTGLSKEQIEARKYGLVAESDRHKRLKRLIHEALEGYASRAKGVADVVEEKRVNSNLPYMNWRKPDVIAKYNNLNIVFELQLSTTFISVVVQRDIFYRLNDFFIIWVFNFDDNQKYVDLTNLMCKDIYYANKRNVFIFDAEAQRASEEREELVLKCNWLDTDNTWHYSPTKGNGDGILITIDELKFDKDTAKPYYFDAETPYYEIHPEVKERIQKEERSKQQMIDDLLARASREAEEAIIKRDNALKLMLENDGHVSPFKDGNKYGFIYNNVILVPAKYSSYSEFGNNGMYKVSFNRHHGLIDKYGNELFACDYLDFHRLSNGLIVAESTSGFYISGIGRISDRSPHDTISLRELTPELFVILHNSSSLDIFIIEDEYLFKKTNNTYAFYSISGEQVIVTTFSDYHFTHGYSALWLKNSESRKWMVTELDGSNKNNMEYINCNFEQERTIANQPGKTDVYNSKGEIIRSTDYDNIVSFGIKDYSKVIKGELCGLVDDNFSEKLSVDYEEIVLQKSFIYAQKGGLWAILDVNCSLLSDFEFDTITGFDRWYSSSWSNWILVKRNNLQGLYNSDGHCVLKAEYESIDADKELLIVKRNGKYGLYNKEGENLIDSQYDKIKPLPNGVNVIVSIEEKSYIYCLLDKHLDKSPYTSIRQLDENYLIVQSGESYGLSDTHGEVRIPISFQCIEKLEKGYSEYHPSIFRCDLNGKVGAYSINDKRIVIATEFDNIEWWNQNVFKVKKGSKWGLYEIGKGYITEIKYDSISPYNNTKISVSLNLRNGHISPKGEEICSESKELFGGYETKQFFSRWSLFKDSEMIIPYEHDDPIVIIDDNKFKVKTGGKYGIKDTNNCYVFQPQYRDILTKDNCNFVIVKLIKNRRERKYTWGRSYHMIDVEYNEYQLFNVDGTQNGIPSNYCGTYSQMEFANSRFLWLDKHILSLDKFMITEDTYTSFDSFDCDGFIRVRKEKFGLLDSDLKLILPCNFDSIEPWGNNLLLTRNDIREGYWYDSSTREEYQLYKKDGINCSVGIFDAYEDVGEGKLKIYKHSKTGFVNLDGEIIPDSVETINNEIIVSKAFEHVEIRSTDGDILAPLSDGLTDVKPLTEAFYIIVKDGKLGVLKVNDKTCIKCDYDSIELWSEGIVLVSKGQYYSGTSRTFSLLSLNGENITTKEYTKISSIENGFADAERDGTTGKLNNRGIEVYDLEEPLNDSLIKRRCFGKWEVINQNKQQVIPCQYDDIVLFDGNMLLTNETKQVATRFSYTASDISTMHTLLFLNGERVLPFEFTTIKKCSNGFYIVTKDSKDALYDHTFNSLVPFEKSYMAIREWSENKYVAQTNSLSYGSLIPSFFIINSQGVIVSKNNYTRIGDLIDGRAEVTFQNREGYINEKCEELVDIVETKGEWSISKFMGRFSIKRGEEEILTNLIEAKFFSDFVISIKKKSNLYSLYSITQKKELSAVYKQIGEFDGSFASVTNQNNLKGTIDKEGKECYDQTIELNDSIIAKRKFSKYDLFKNGDCFLTGIFEVSLWDFNKLKIQIDGNTFQIYSLDENKYIGERYNQILELVDGKAKVTKNRSVGYIDDNTNVIPSEDIVITSNMHKIKKFDFWYIVDDNSNQIIDESFKEIGTYKGRYIKFNGSEFRLLDHKSKCVIPVYGTYYKNCTSTIIYLVGGHYVRVQKKMLDLKGKSLSEFINENKTLKLVINYINFKKQAVYAKPYKEPKDKEIYPPYELGQIIEGKVFKVLPYGIRIRNEDGRNTLIHKSQLQKQGYGDFEFELSQSVTIKKSGYDEEHKKDIWDIISPIVQTEEDTQ